MENIGYRILLVEDDKLDQMAFLRMVKDKELSYDCTVAGSVSEADNILKSKVFDIVIADYMLGDGTAFDILELANETPVIFVTGVGDEEIATQAWKAGACDYLIKDPQRNYLKAVPVTIENTIKHKKTEERLQLLSHAVMSTDDSIYITDMDDKIIFVNKAFCETYGYAEEELIGKDSNILCQEGPLSADARNIYQDVNVREVGFYHKRKDGNKFPVSLSRSVVKDKNGNEIALVGVARNISERLSVEDKIRTLNQTLLRGNRRIT